MLEDHIRTKADEIAADQGCYFDDEWPNTVRSFIEEYCILYEHPFTGQKLKLLDWQWKDLILPLYGWRNPDGSLRFKTAICFLPRKAGKSTLLGALGTYTVLKYPGGQSYCICSSVKQAGSIFRAACNFAETHPALKKRLWVRRAAQTIEDPKHKSFFQILAYTPKQSSYSSNLILYDEVAEWGANAQTIWERLHDSDLSREDGLHVTISTSQYDRTSLGYELYKQACDILAGTNEATDILPVIYSLKDGEDWTDPENWWKTQPGIDVTVKRSKYYARYEGTKNNPNNETSFRTFLLCQWVGHSQSWIASNMWAKCYEDFTEDDLVGYPAIAIGCDMARRYDLAAYTILIEKDEQYYLVPRAFIPSGFAAYKEKEDNVPYSRWHKQGHIIFTDGETIDHQTIRQHIEADQQKFEFTECRYDPYAFDETRNILEQELGLYLVEVPQTYSHMSPATAHFEKLVLDGKIRHNNNPVLTWCLENCTTRSDYNDRILIDKRKSRGRIDCITASIIALSAVVGGEHIKGGLPPVFSW